MEFFIKKWSEVSGRRFDPLYLYFNIQTLLKRNNYNIDRIGNYIVEMKTGFAAGKQDQTDSIGVLQIRPTNLNENGQLKFDKNIYVPKDSVSIEDYIQKGEVLFNNTNSQELVGKTAYFDLEGDFVCSNHITRIKTKADKLLPKYLWILLNIYQKYNIFFNTCVNWNNQSGINIELLKSYTIPIPPKEIQQQIINIMDNAYLLKAQKENEAKNILDSIDSYILDELGIALPYKNTDLRHRIYTTKLSSISGKRFDCEYHQNYYNELEEAISQGKYQTVTIRDNVFVNQQLESMEKYDFINYIDLSCIEKDNGLVKNTIIINSYYPSRARQKVFKGDLLVSTLSGSMKAIALIEENKENLIASTGFFVISRVRNISKYFLMSILRTDLFQILLKREASGSIMSSINYNDFLNLKIPLPPLSAQEKIANEIIQRKQKALNLQREAKNILESAKIQVEKIILGEER